MKTFLVALGASVLLWACSHSKPKPAQDPCKFQAADGGGFNLNCH